MNGRWRQSLAIGLVAACALGGAACSGSGDGGGGAGGGDAASGGDARPAGPADTAAGALAVRIIAPLAAERLPATVALAFEGSVEAPGEAVTTLVAVWESDVAGRLGESEPAAGGGLRLDVAPGTLAPGPHTLTLSVTSPAGRSGAASVLVRVNHPPAAPKVAIRPTPADTAADLRAVVETDSVDADGDVVTYPRWTWLKDGAVQPGLTAMTVPAGRTTRGETWEVRIWPADALDSGPYGSATVLIENSLPTVGRAVLSPSAGDGFTTFACAAEDVQDEDAEDPRLWFVTWEVDGAVVPVEGRCAPGCVGPADCAPGTVCGAAGRCGPEGAACTADTGCAAPASVCHDGACVQDCGETGCPEGLACHAASGHCAPALGECRVDGDCAAGSVCVGEPGATLSGGVSAGDSLVCVVTPFDGSVLGAPVSSTAAAIVNAAPEVRAVRLLPEAADVTTELRCVVDDAVDPDGDVIRFDYVWEVKGPCGVCVFEALPGTASATLVNPTVGERYFERGDRVRCRVAPDDGSGAGVPALSNEVLVGNAPPLYGSVSIVPAPTATEADVLQCVPNDPIDPDGDGTSPATYVWWLNGAVLAGATGATLDGTWFDKDDAVACGVIATDGYDEGELVESKVATRIVNSPPALQAAHLTPVGGAPAQTYTCAAVGWADADPPDADGPGVSQAELGIDVTAPMLRHVWYRNGVVQEVAVTDTTFGPLTLATGEELQCAVVPFDGQDEGAAVLSNVVRMPGPPSVGAVAVTPAAPRTADDLTCVPHDVVDPDGDEVGLAWEWLRDGAVVAGYDAATLPAAATAKGEEWACRVTPSDAGGAGAPATAPPVTIRNTPPGAPLVTVEPPGAAPGETLTCTIAEASADADGDAVTYAVQWSLDGADLAGETGETIVSDPSVGCGAWRCTVTPSDDEAAGAPGMGEVLTASGSALAFDGADFAEIGHTAALSLGPTGQLTIEAWVRPAGAPVAGTIARKQADDAAPGFTLGLAADGAATVAVRTADGAATITAAAALPPDRWAHVAASYNGTLAFLFVNGQLQGTETLSGSAESPASLYLGGLPGGAAPVFPGRVDEVRLSSIAVYQASFSPPLPLEAALGTKGLWHLDEGQGTLFYDATDGGSAGAAVGTQWVEGICVPSRNQAPGAPVVVIEPNPAYDDSALVCDVLVESFDPDGDEVDYAVSWARDDVPQPAYEGLWTVPAAATAVGERWTCRVVPTDGLVEGPAAFAERLVEEQGWVVSGTYDVSPSINYECTFGLVQLYYTRLSFFDNGVTLRLEPNMNAASSVMCYMSGGSAQDDGHFDVQCTLYGTCNETYRLVGDFTSADQFSASFTVTFSGGELCFDCENQAVELSGTRVQ